MKKIGSFFVTLGIMLVMIFSLAGCGNDAKPTSYYINNEGNLIVVLDDGKENDLGEWGEDIILSLGEITVSSDGYYVINGVKTKISQEKPVSYYLDSNNNLIAKYADESTKNLGQFGKNLIESLSTVEVDGLGFYVINGVKTDITTKIPDFYTINNNGHLIVTYLDGSTADLGLIGDSLVNGVSSVEISEDGFYIINGIKTDILAIDVYTVSFNTGYSATVVSQIIKDGYKVEKPTLDRIGYTLDGWYCNNEEWHFNSDVVKNDMTLSAKWTANEYTVDFVNEMGTNPVSINVAFDSNVTLPTVDEVDGYTFAGWYYNSQVVNNGKWSIATNATLTAKWTANEYTITLDPGAGSVSKTTVNVTYDEDFTLPVPTNDYGVFTGWLYNDEPITDSTGHSLTKWNFTSDITLTVDWTVKIYTVEDLLKMGTYLNGDFILMNDIDLSGVNWNPIGINSAPFTGHLDGNGHKISNLTIDTSNYTNRSSFGLFGYISFATIEDLVIEDFEFTSENIEKTYYVGALAGIDLTDLSSSTNEEPLIKEITTSGSYVVAKQSSSYPVYAGGLFGKVSFEIISNCKNFIGITNASHAGGLVGTATKMMYALNSSNEGQINSTLYAGGLLGKCGTAFYASESSNKADITSVQAAGGLVGSVDYYAVITLCYNTGNITSTTDNTFLGAGGLIGCCYSTGGEALPSVEISESYNRGNISAPCAGGLLGVTYEIKLTNVYNAGSVSGNKYSGSIFAYSSVGSVKQCLGSGSVSGSAVKSTIGYGLTNVTFTDCYHTFSSTSNFGKVTGTYISSKYGSTTYTDNMFWKEYNESTGKGSWIFSDNDYPKLFWE
jgi:hypothetical protein